MATQYKLITDREGFKALRTCWNELVSKCEVDHAFMRHEWFDCWIDAFYKTGPLAVQTAWNNGQMVAVAPMRIATQKRRGIQFKILQFLESGISPRCNLIVHPDVDENDFFDSLFDIPGWDFMELHSVELEQPISKALIQYLLQKRDCVVEPGLKSPYEVLEGTWESFLSNRTMGYRKSFRKCMNRLHRAVNHEIVVLETPEDFERHFDDMLAVSARSWKATGGTDIPSTAQAEFYRSFSRIGAEEGLCIAYLLYLNGNPIGFQYKLRHNKKLAGIRSDYDVQYKYYMPGSILHAHAIKEVLGKGEPWEYDLCGLPTEFKLGLVRSLRQHVNITVGKPGMQGKLIIMIKKIVLRMSEFSEQIHVPRRSPDNRENILLG